MGYLFHILIALGAEGLGELGFTAGWRAPWGIVALLPIPHALSWLGQRAFAAGAFLRGARLARLVHHAPPLLYVALVGVFGWVESSQGWTSGNLGAFSWPRPALALALAPYVLFELIAIDAQARLHDTRPAERRAVRSFQVRMFASALLPLVLYLLLSGLVAASDAIRVHVEHVALFNAAFMVVLLVALALALPILLKNTWETVALPPGPQRSVLEDVARRASFRARELLVWRTGNLMTNAAIVGLSPRSRVVLFSDSLLAILSLRELAAVFAHEMGHALRHHVWIFIGWALAFFLSADLATQALADYGAWWSGAALVTTLVLWAVSFGWMSRRFELEADLFSLELLDDPASLIQALERVGARDRTKGGWRHFSTNRRVEFLLRAAADPAWARRFRTRLRRIAIGGGLFALVALAFELRGLASTYSTDRVWADLALGRYSAAAERAQGAQNDVDPELVELARLGATFAEQLPESEAPVTARALTEAAQAAVAAGDLPLAAGLADLAVLRGADGLLPVARALEELVDGDTDAARSALGDAGPGWRAALEAWLGPQ